MQSIEEQIERLVLAKPRGTLFFPEDFEYTGSSEAIRKALQRLENKGSIRRVAHGIYVRPKESSYIGEVMPTAEEVAEGIAKRDKIRIVPTGVYALHALGLSTQIPLKLVFLTDGAARTIKVGKRTIKLKRTTPKNLMAKGKISSLVIQALREIGKDKASQTELKQIIKLLKEEDQQLLKHDIKLAPEWIKQIMKEAINA
ncbi:MAG: type IV toxin-antitoxin system AbiEi family antitoxin domain-containing protein [Prolixibacteraceae bacterium]|nr:type IV toxin-antitoxin system AbiEi family antitoxin domain-containing protein [Prolixibacteraceae bacterium]